MATIESEDPDEFVLEFQEKLVRRLKESIAKAPVNAPKIPWTAEGTLILRNAFVKAIGIAAASHQVPVRACDRWNPCAQMDCTRCFPGKIIPPDQRGSKKPGGGAAAKPRPKEKGFRIVSWDVYMEMPLEAMPGDRFVTPDIALSTAKKRAKSSKERYLVLRDGVVWQTVARDGSVDE